MKRLAGHKRTPQRRQYRRRPGPRGGPTGRCWCGHHIEVSHTKRRRPDLGDEAVEYLGCEIPGCPCDECGPTPPVSTHRRVVMFLRAQIRMLPTLKAMGRSEYFVCMGEALRAEKREELLPHIEVLWGMR